MFYIDQVLTHDDSGTGDNTVPPGIVDLDWCHLVSSVSLADLIAFLEDNFETIGCDPANIRTPPDSNVTYVGLTFAQRMPAINAGALPRRQHFCIALSFDTPGPDMTYEP